MPNLLSYKYLFIILTALFLFSALSVSLAYSPWSKTDPALNMVHIFEGEINKRGKPVGFHKKLNQTGAYSSRIKKMLSKPNKAGVYTAIVEIYDRRQNKWKDKFSSMFPDRLTKQQVVQAILRAISQNRLGTGAKWRGPSGYGFMIEGYRLYDGRVNTAYPLYTAD